MKDRISRLLQYHYNWKMISPQGCNFQMGGLAYDSIPLLGLSLQSSIEFI